MKKIKDGVSVSGLRPEMLLAFDVANEVYEALGVEFCVLTAGVDGEHGRGSLHYVGLAIDTRTRDFPNGGNNSDLIDVAVKLIQDRLGKQYDVVRESNHLHIEFQPK